MQLRDWKIENLMKIANCKLKISGTRGFTMTELLVVISIIGLMTAISVPNFKEAQKSLALERASHQVAKDLKRAMELAWRAQPFDNCPSGSSITGYGFYSSVPATSYNIYADCTPAGEVPDRVYTQERDGIVENIQLESNIEIFASFAAPFNVVFEPPIPIICIMSSSCANAGYIDIRVKDNIGMQRRVEISNKGVINLTKP